MKRRSFLQAGLAAGALGACARPTEEERRGSSTMTTTTGRMPAIFLAHGSPFLLDDERWVSELHAWAKAMPRPKAVLVLSAHWLDAPTTIGATTTAPLEYDFYNFPKRYYDVTYAAPGAPDVANRVRELLADRGGTAEAPLRGLDHGAYIPLIAMYPEADVPVLQVSIPSLSARELLPLGRALAPLRDEGVLVLGSGFLTHNFQAMDMDPNAKPAGWAVEFDAWCRDALTRRDVDAIADYKVKAPAVRMALPTHEHFVPVVAALGASLDTSEAATFPIDGFTYGSMTKRSVQFG